MLQVKHLTLTHRRDLRVLVDDFSFVLNPGDKAVDRKSTRLNSSHWS